MNTTNYSFLSCKEQFELLLKQYVKSHPRIRTLKTRREYSTIVRNFRCWWLSQGQPDIIKEVFLNWMNDGVQKAKVVTMESKVTVLTQFLTFLKDQGFIDPNPLIELRKEYLTLGYRGILREMKRTGSISSVLEMADIPFSGTLAPGIITYLDYLAALGKQCANHRSYLISFERFLRKNNISSWSQVDRSLIENWVNERQPSSGYQRRCWLLVLDDLFQFLVNRDDVSSSPVPPPGKHFRRYLPPYIFSNDEVRAVLDEASNLPDHRLMPLRGKTYRMLFLTLYTLGLRISEALNLRLGDLDFTQHCLTIGKTKFYKGRVLPFGPRYESTLREYLSIHPMLRVGDRNTYIFPTDTGRTPRLVRNSAYRTLRRIVRKLGLVTPPETRSPSLHSFRHSFAVHRVEQWLSEGADVNSKLPLLSAFLGHVDAAATQVYLTMTPQRLALIGNLFETRVGRRS